MLTDEGAVVELSSLDGFVLDDRYRLIHRVGAGGVGVVYRARHLRIPRDLAVKMLLPKCRGNAEMISRFHREVYLQARLCHPNIVEVIDFGEHEVLGLYIVMEFLEGESLAERVARDGVLQILDVLKIAEQCGSALSFAHVNGVVHRDVKAENLYLTKTPGPCEGFDVRLLDFGIAQVDEANRPALTRDSSMTPPGRSVGTPYSMSPEQITGASVDRRSDIYSFGVLLYDLLAGVPPFEGASAQDYLRAHLVTPAPSLRLRNSTRWVPQALDQLVLAMLEKDPDRRPQSIAEVLDGLDGLRTLILSRWAEAHLSGRQRQHLRVHSETSATTDVMDSVSVPDSDAESSPPVVVIIDDESATRFLIRQHVSRAGYNAVLFENAREALRWLQTHEPPACVGVDLLMPQTNGLDFMRMLRTRLPELPVIVCSGLESTSVLDEAMRTGASRVLQKHQLHRLPRLLDEVLDESRVSA